MATLKQKKAFKEAVENGGNVSRAMIDVGYSPATAHTPQKLTDTKGWKELMEEYIPDDLLARKHLELLNKREVIRWFNHATGEMEMEVTDQPDGQAVPKALDMAYKLKGSYAAEKKVTLHGQLPKPILDVSIYPSDKENNETKEEN